MSRENRKKSLSSTILWRIENLCFWESEFHPQTIESCSFSLNNLSSSLEINKFYINQYPDKPNSRICISFQSRVLLIPGKLEWSIMDVNGLPIYTEIIQENRWVGVFSMPNAPTYADIFVNKTSTYMPDGTFTVQLRFISMDFVKAEHVSIVTRIEAPTESFVLLIERFITLQLDEEVVTSVKLDEEVLKLIFSLRGTTLEDADVSFRIIAGEPRDQSLKVKLSILDGDENEAVTVEEKQRFSSKTLKQIWVMPKMLSRREILEKGSDWLHGGDLKFRCKFVSNLNYNEKSCIEIYYIGPENPTTDIQENDEKIARNAEKNPRSIVSSISKKKFKISTQSLNQLDTPKQISLSNTILGEDLLSAYNEQILNDFELRSGDVSFPVHKIVLSARSPVFKSMFCGDMKESGSRSMDVPDLDCHTLGRMLTFMYGGALDELEWESATKLYYAADKYELLSLKQHCSTFLGYNITVSNVSDILELADRHQDKELTSHVHDFIGDNFKEVIASDEWDKFLGRSCLAGKAMKEVLQKGFQKN